MSWLSWLPGRSRMRVFISYRKADSKVEASAIAAHLRAELGRDRVFFDDSSLPKGKDYLPALKKELFRAKAVFAIIGKTWLTARDPVTNELRLNQPNDVLRQELELALNRGIPVVPILLEGVTSIPQPDQLPSSLNDLKFSRQQAHLIKSITDLEPEIDGLLDRLRRDTAEAEWTQLRERIRDIAFALIWVTVIVAPLGLLAWLMPWGAAGVVVGLGLTFVALWAPRWWYSKLYKLIKETLFSNVPYGWWKAYRELLTSMVQAWGAPSVEMVARVRIEVALLNPEPTPPPPNTDPETGKRERDEWRSQRAALRRLVNNTVRQTLDAIAASVHEPPLLHVATCFQLNNAAANVNRYLNLTQQLFPELAETEQDAANSDEDARRRAGGLRLPHDEFYCRVRVGQGFLAPQHLIAGMQDHYDEDWRPVLNWYGRAVLDQAGSVATRIRKVQVFQFLCWLMWGPSIPHCTCTQWNRSWAVHPGLAATDASADGSSADRSTTTHPSSYQLVYQFGYGDEGNSWPLCHDGSRGSPLRKFLDESFQKEPASRAFQCRVTVKPKAASRIAENVCPAQSDALENADLALRLLNIDHFTGTAEKESRRIYQAYVWIMFVLCDSSGEPLFPDEPWKALVPFFVHGNIADDETFRFVRQQVVTIALNSVRELMPAQPDVCYRYACASDDGNCRSPLEFAPATPPMLEILRQSLTDSDRQRTFLPDGLENTEFAEIFAACHLPDLVRRFYQSLPAFNELDEDAGDLFINLTATAK